MRSLFGLMPSEEVSIERRFKDTNGLGLLIQAGSKGWSIIYADHSSEYMDSNETPENNFEKAYRVATDAVGHLTAY